MRFELSGTNPVVRINWGDGKNDTYKGRSIEAYHVFPKDPTMLFIIQAFIDAERIVYVDPTGGDCEFELIDFSEAPSIYEISTQRTNKVILDNPNLEHLDLDICLGDNYDLSKCPELRTLHFDGESDKLKSLDLSHCHKLHTFSYMGYCCQNMRKIAFANDAPLYEADISGHNFFPSCLDAIRRIIDRNNGFLIGETESEPNDLDEPDSYIQEHLIERRNIPSWRIIND